MGRYGGAKDVKVQDRNPMLNEEDGEHVIVYAAGRDGDSANSGLPYTAFDFKVKKSDTYGEGSVRTHLCAQRAGKGQRNYYLADVKSVVGGILDFADKSEVDEQEIEAVVGAEGLGVGAVLVARVYSKPPNKDGKVFKGVSFTFLAESEEEYDALMGE